MLEKRGMVLIGRQSSLWLLREHGVVYPLFKIGEHLGRRNAGIAFYHFVVLLESLMNLVPLLRIFESRCIMVFEKQ